MTASCPAHTLLPFHRRPPALLLVARAGQLDRAQQSGKNTATGAGR